MRRERVFCQSADLLLVRCALDTRSYPNGYNQQHRLQVGQLRFTEPDLESDLSPEHQASLTDNSNSLQFSILLSQRRDGRQIVLANPELFSLRMDSIA
ncbi:hypothetical protein ElyMa_006123100 [Elysia marginata]|uniref:Uncharacterized protein n=1 Tax=Elysia marginata TaxID=1093978 RepID=A0AAV4GW49_9GAST|nr:hypothetical protein ElyMa_006123100 [Elysia marginata]